MECFHLRQVLGDQRLQDIPLDFGHLQPLVIVHGLLEMRQDDIPLEDFSAGLGVELEHGTQFQDANVTNNHPILTGKIVLAHLKESMDYYKRLEVAEIEGDILKALVAKNLAKVEALHKKLAQAKLALYQVESRELG